MDGQLRSLRNSGEGLALDSDRHSFRPMVQRHRKLLSPLKWFWLVVMWLLVNVCSTSSQGSCDLEQFETPLQGQYVCGSHPDLVLALEVAEEMGRRECERAFEWERWNCSGFSIFKSPNITNSPSVTKEAAYVQAISLAAIAHTVAKFCALGDATSCTCDQEEFELPEGDSDTTYHMGCSDNVEFGITFAHEFLRLRHTGNGIRQQVEQHNRRIGANVVQFVDENPYICRCMGLSGSCTVLTCQYELPEFSVIADRIHDIYSANHSCKAEWNHDVGPGSTIMPQGCEEQLIYLHDSPDYCVRNVAAGILGTVDRECNPHSTGHGSCSHLCTQCGRGHTNVEEEVETNCWCEFVFCCDINCDKCPETRDYHVCT